MARPSSRSGFTRSLGGMKYPGESEHARLRCRGGAGFRPVTMGAARADTHEKLRQGRRDAAPSPCPMRARKSRVVSGVSERLESRPAPRSGCELQVAVLAGVLGLAASAFS